VCRVTTMTDAHHDDDDDDDDSLAKLFVAVYATPICLSVCLSVFPMA